MAGPPRDLERVHAVTSNLFFWQGLRFVPMGVALLLFAARYASWWPLTERWSDVYVLAVLVLGLVASHAAGAHYARTYGRVRALPGAHAARTLAKWLVVYPAMATSLTIDAVFGPPIFWTGIVWGLSIYLYWESTGGGRVHYAGAVLIALSTTLWPRLGLAAPGLPMVNEFIGVLGVIYVVCGLLDHLELRRILRPLPDDA